MKKIAKYFKVLSDETRLKIILLLLEGEECSCTLIDSLNVTQPTLSYHLKYLSDNKITTTKRDGNWIKHYINKEILNELILFLKNLTEMKPSQCNI